MVREPISLYLPLVGVFCRFLMPRKDASHHWCASTCPSPTQPLFTIHDKQHCGWHPRPQKIYLRPSSSWDFHLHSYDEHWAVSVNPGTEIHIWGGASNWHRTRKFFVDRECEEFIGCPPGRGIRAGISGSDRMLLGPKATEAASNKVNWGTHRLRWLLGIRTFDLSSLEAIIQLLLHTLFLYLCEIFSVQTSLCLASSACSVLSQSSKNGLLIANGPCMRGWPEASICRVS